jgi:hypothetical protein
MVTLEEAFLLFVFYYTVFTAILVFLIESRFTQVEREVETLLVEYLELKKKLNNSEKR